jgi:hypothetical protein
MRTRTGLKALGLSALVVGVMAVGTSGVAQAEVGACWGYTSGATLSCFSTTLEAKPLIALEGNTNTLLIANLNLEILCTAAAFIEGGTFSANGSILLGRLDFSGCITLTKTPTLTKLNACTPQDPVGRLGHIRSEKGTGLIVLHSGEPVVELKPDVGTVLAKIFLGELCAHTEEIIITGKLIIQEAGGKASFETHQLTHLSREFASLQLMRAGANVATIDGTASITLATPHQEFKWAGHGA